MHANPPYSYKMLIALAVFPAGVLVVSMLLVRAAGYLPHEASYVEAVGTATLMFGSIYTRSGPVALLLVSANYVLVFGIVAVITDVALRRFWWKRVASFYLVNVLVLTVVAFNTPNPAGLPVAQISAYVPAYIPAEPDHWRNYLVQYPPYALLLSLLCGLCIAMLPIFKPDKRYWLKRGMCPNCQYDLRGKTDAGCPECGWNRPAATAPASTSSSPSSASTSTD